MERFSTIFEVGRKNARSSKVHAETDESLNVSVSYADSIQESTDDNRDGDDNNNNDKNYNLIPEKKLKHKPRQSGNRTAKVYGDPKLLQVFDQNKDAVEPIPPNIVETVAFDEEDDEQKRNEMIIRQNFLKILQKRRYRRYVMLSVFIVAAVFSIACILRWIILFNTIGVAASNNGEESCYDAISSYIWLATLAPIGFVLSYFRPYVFLGILFVLGSFYTLLQVVNGTSLAILAHSEDSLSGNMEIFLVKFFNRTGSVPPFYQNLQKSCECCGFNNMDRLKDWPFKTRSFDFPSSCCKNGDGNTCTGLGRMYNATRVPSGFTIIQDESFMRDWASEKGQLSKVNTNFKLSNHQSKISQDIVEPLIQRFEKEINEDLRLLQYRSKLPENAIPSEILLKLDAQVEEMVYNGHVSRGQWIYFKLLKRKVGSTTTSEIPQSSTLPTTVTAPTTTPEITTTPKSTTTTTIMSTTESSDFDPNRFCRNKTAMYYLHPSICMLYIKCVRIEDAMRGELLTCPKWLHFSFRHQNCTVPAYARCPYAYLVNEDDKNLFEMDEEQWQRPGGYHLYTFYASRGIAENFLLDQVLWKNRCERDVQSKNIVEGFLTCGALQSNDPPSGSPIANLKLKERSSKFFFENAHIYILAWQYSLLPFIGIFTFVCVVIFGYFVAKMQTSAIKALAPQPESGLLRMHFPDIQNMDPITRQAHEALFRKRLKEMNKRMRVEYVKRKKSEITK